MTELNDISPIQIKKIDENNAEICDTSNLGEYISNDTMIKAKIPKIIDFRYFFIKL